MPLTRMFLGCSAKARDGIYSRALLVAHRWVSVLGTRVPKQTSRLCFNDLCLPMRLRSWEALFYAR